MKNEELKLMHKLSALSQMSPMGEFQIKLDNEGETPFLIAPLPVGIMRPFTAVVQRVLRVVECVNAMEGIKDPAAFIEVVKGLELDAYQKLKNHTEELVERVTEMRLIQKYCSPRKTTQQEEQHLLILENRVDNFISICTPLINKN